MRITLVGKIFLLIVSASSGLVFSNDSISIKGKLVAPPKSSGRIDVFITGSIVDPPEGLSASNIYILENGFTATIQDKNLLESCNNGVFNIDASHFLNNNSANEFYLSPSLQSIICNDEKNTKINNHSRNLDQKPDQKNSVKSSAKTPEVTKED